MKKVMKSKIFDWMSVNRTERRKYYDIFNKSGLTYTNFLVLWIMHEYGENGIPTLYDLEILDRSHILLCVEMLIKNKLMIREKKSFDDDRKKLKYNYKITDDGIAIFEELYKAYEIEFEG